MYILPCKLVNENDNEELLKLLFLTNLRYEKINTAAYFILRFAIECSD